MEKIPTLFERDEATNRRYVRNVVTPGCEWVLAGEGAATRKFDGICVRLSRDGLWWFRREVKAGKDAPIGFVPVQFDEVTGSVVGWEPAEGSGFFRFLMDAVDREPGPDFPWTYELLGPKINGNPEHEDEPRLMAHGSILCPDAPRDFEGLQAWLMAHDFEGLVWWHEDGRRAKLKRKDFPEVEREATPVVALLVGKLMARWDAEHPEGWGLGYRRAHEEAYTQVIEDLVTCGLRSIDFA